uniref:non-specific serine/threonine protein kinase n=1 Tax=Caenorhabditis japonica TaxID=281687 RepID=A0A8R1IZJ8_CAEJA
MKGSRTTGDISKCRRGVVHCFVIEECMLAGREYSWVECPSHGGLHMRELAPDTVFADIENALTIHVDQLKRSRMLGRGAFGFVFRATLRQPNGELCEVAQKMLEPVDPGPGGRASALAAYKAAADKWKRDSLEFACRAYCTSRQELSLLSRMKHQNVIGLVGMCTFPLSLVVELAPLGALNQLLASHRKAGTKLSLGVIKESAVQVARALEYLHSAHIIYRDLKSENVLGWRFPAPFSPQTDVLLKLGDYGISRSVLPSGGAKGFGGTEGFMAPEIVRFNGEEEYTQKVDCFSFGMFLYDFSR